MYFRTFCLSFCSVGLRASTSSASLPLSGVSFIYFLVQLAPPHCSSFSGFSPDLNLLACVFLWTYFFSSFIEVSLIYQYNCVHLRSTMCGCDTFTYCKMITTSQYLITKSFFVVRTFKIYSLVYDFLCCAEGFLDDSVGKESACHAGDLGSIPGLGRSAGEGNGSPFQFSGLENSMDCVAHGVTKSGTRLSDFHFAGQKL